MLREVPQFAVVILSLPSKLVPLIVLLAASLVAVAALPATLPTVSTSVPGLYVNCDALIVGIPLLPLLPYHTALSLSEEDVSIPE